jgi:dTDP-glucose pyrophosphorylase
MNIETEYWRETLLPGDATVHQAIQNMNESAAQIALVVAPSGTLLGTITDGDIRRGLIAGLSLDSPIESIVHHDALVVPPEIHRDTVLQLMRANRIHQLPIVDEDRKVVGLHLIDDLIIPETRTNLMVIMAGGRGERLRPHTENCPKPLLEVAGKPMLEHIIERARGEGLMRFVVAVHYLGHMIEEYFDNGSRWGVQIEYLQESTPLGTAGALGLLQSRPEDSFIVSNGDILTDIRYLELLEYHIRSGAAATMAVRLHEWQQPYGVVKTRGIEIVGFEEKPVVQAHVNAGIYALEPSALDVLDRGEPCDMPALFQRLQDTGARTIVYPMHEPWVDVGRPTDLDQANGNSDDQ